MKGSPLPVIANVEMSGIHPTNDKIGRIYMTTQQEFCYREVSNNSCYAWKAAYLLRSLEEPLALGAQHVASCHKVIELLPACEYTLNSLVKDDLRLV